MGFVSRPILAALGGLLLVCAGGGLWFYAAHRADLRQDIEEDLKAVASLRLNEIKRWQRARLADASVLADEIRLAERFRTGTDSAAEDRPVDILSLFESYCRLHRYRDILLVDSQGHILLSFRGAKGRLGNDAVDALPEVLSERKARLMDLHIETVGRFTQTCVIAPLEGPSTPGAASRAVVLVTNARNFLFPLIQFWPIPSKTAETLLVRRIEGHVLYLNDLRHRRNAGMRLRIPLDWADKPAVMAVTGKEGIVEGKDYRDVHVLAVLRSIPNSSWHLVAKMDADEALAVFHRESLMILIALAALIAVLGVAALWVLQRREAEHYQELYCSEAKAHEQEMRYGIILQSVADAVIVTDPRGVVQMMNPVAEKLTGWNSEAALGASVEEVFEMKDEEQEEYLVNPVRTVLSDDPQAGAVTEGILLANDGAKHPISTTAAPIHYQPGEISGVVLAFQDQTKARFARERERHLKQVLLGIRNVNQLIIQERDPARLVDKACANLVETMGYQTAWIALFGKAEKGVQHVSAAGFERGVDAMREHLFRQQWPSCVKRACQTGDIVVIDDVRTICADCPFACLMTDRRMLAMALQFGDRTSGVLCVSVPRRFAHDPEDQNLFREVCQDMAFALHEIDVAEALEQKESEYRELFETAPVGIFTTASTGEALRMNTAMGAILGFSSGEEAAAHYADLAKQLYVAPERRREFLEMLRQNGAVEDFDVEARRIDGERVWLNMNAHIARWLDDERFVIDGFITDITRRRTAEHERDQMQGQLAQVQRMNAIGRLAGGIAHDFNNLLLGIMNYVDLCRGEIPEDHPIREWLDEISLDAQRSADLTRQLLAFARKQTIAPKPVDINSAVTGMLTMLRRLIGEDVNLVWEPGEAGGTAEVDPSQLDQVLANLVVNARDAIGGAGEITLETQAVSFDEAYREKHADVVPGDFVMLAVSDTGCGMDETVQDQIFEPFFTTKAMGEGVGMGLATVYGIVKQNKGFVNVYSEVNKGTTFRIYLPQSAETPEAEVEPEEPHDTGQAEEEWNGPATILLVEDEPSVRKTARIFLERYGYTVLSAGTPEEAMKLASEHGDGLDILITDVVMPGMSGRELADQLEDLHPGLKCLYISGYTASVIEHRGVLEKDVAFLSKPFKSGDLARKVREVLGTRASDA